MNKSSILGRLTRDPETKYSNSGVAVTRFSVAVPRKFKKENEQDADFINCVSFGKQAEFISNYFKKGQQIAIVGRIQTGSYKDGNGNTKYTFEIAIEEVEFCGDKTESTNQTTNQQIIKNTEDDYYSINNLDDDNLPF